MIGDYWITRGPPLGCPGTEVNGSMVSFNGLFQLLIPGSSIRDPFGRFIRDLFRGENVTSIWAIKRSLGRSW